MHPIINLPHLILFHHMDVQLYHEILAYNSDVCCGEVVYECFATVAKRMGTELEDRVVRVQVQRFADHDIEIAV
jgi:hypothetical protein